MKIFRNIDRMSGHAVVLCADAVWFPIAYAICARLAAASDGKYDVHLLTEPSDHFQNVPDRIEFQIACPDFVERIPSSPPRFRSRPFTFLRLFAPELLAGYKKLLYLDCDISVVASVAPLFDLDMGAAVIAAVDSSSQPFFPSLIAKHNEREKRRRASIGLDVKRPNLNAGVLLIDADKWRSQDITPKAMKCIVGHGDKLLHNDQDVLNVLFQKNWAALSPRWNFLPRFFDLGFEAILNPVVYHFAGQRKPWMELKWHRSSNHIDAVADLIRDTPFDISKIRAPPGRGRESWREFRRAFRRAMQNVTFFLPSSRARIYQRKRQMIPEYFCRYLIDGVTTGRFIDVKQGISHIDINAIRQSQQRAVRFD